MIKTLFTLLTGIFFSFSLFAQGNSVKPPNYNSGQSSSSSSNGCILGDCQNGWGGFKYYNGDYYFGLYKDGMRNYLGAYYYNSGASFIGNWQDNEDGQGIYINSEGGWKVITHPGFYWPETGCLWGDCDNGFGVYVYDNQDIHVGFWDMAGEKHLFGAQFWTDGDFWIGVYNHGDRDSDAHGIYAWDDGTYEIYTDAINYLRGGTECKYGDCDYDFGIYWWESGDHHTGYWDDGYQDYLSFKFWADGDFFFGLYKDGERLNRGFYVYEDGSVEARTSRVSY